MRAIRIEEHGGPGVLVAGEVEEPVAGPGQLVVELAAAGVNYIDTYFRSGLYPKDPPFVVGVEGAGTVAAVADDVTDFAVGDRVATSNVAGSYAERFAVDATAVVRVPDDAELDLAAAVLLQGMTAHYLVHDTHPVAVGDAVLVHAGAGGMGLLLCQMARTAGAR